MNTIVIQRTKLCRLKLIELAQNGGRHDLFATAKSLGNF
jgi:hypothetical protein